MSLDRRSFLKAGLAGVGAAALGRPARASELVNLALPALPELTPSRTNISHVVVVMMENRSADHYLGWWGDRADTRFDASTKHPTRPTYDFGVHGEQNFTGAPFGDPNHGHSGGRYQILDEEGADGVPDGWDRRPESGTDRYALSYYTGDDLPVIRQILKDFTSFDRYFSSWMGSTYPNRYYMHSAQSGGVTDNAFPPEQAAEGHPEWTLGYDWPTLWDQLTAAGVTWKYYFSNLPAIGLFGPRHAHSARLITEYYADAAAGTLPQVSFVDPFFTAPEGMANDDHPHADIRLGQEFYSDVTTAFMRSPSWARGAMFINYDEWGGFWDHVVPPAVGPNVDPRSTNTSGVNYTQEGPWTNAATADFGLHGFRTPAFLLSPYARNTGANPVPGKKKPKDPRRTIDRTHSGYQDHTTVLKFITENWGIKPPGEWDAGARKPMSSMMAAFDPSVLEPGNPGLPEVDVEAYEYVAPDEVRATPVKIPTSSVSELWSAADWLESQGYTINTRFEDALPATRTVSG